MAGEALFLGQSAFEWLSVYGYYILPLLVVTIGPLAGFAGGFVASTGALNPFAVFFIWYVMIIITDALFFWLGRSGRSFLERFKWTKRFMKKLEEGKGSLWMERMKTHYIKLFIFLKISPTVTLSDLLAFVGGFTDVAYKRQFIASLTGQFIWSGVFVGAGYYFGGAVEDTDRLLRLIFVVLGICAIIYLVYIKFIHSFVVKMFGETLSVLKGIRHRR